MHYRSEVSTGPQCQHETHSPSTTAQPDTSSSSLEFAALKRAGAHTEFSPGSTKTAHPFLRRDAFASKPKVVVCPNSGHFPTATEPDIVINELKRFLNEIRKN
jgi:pimeloyl-ACP methyl ester carboxylesterase